MMGGEMSGPEILTKGPEWSVFAPDKQNLKKKNFFAKKEERKKK